ncbi:MAG: chromate transporter [Prevotella sp.]
MSETDFYKESFKTFFRIGLFTLGGGYAMIPLIETEIVDKKKWIGKEDFMDIVAMAQTCPGVFAINVSVIIGYKLHKIKGALCTCIGTALPSFLIILAIALFFRHFKDNAFVAALFRGIRPAVVALIAVPTFRLAQRARITMANCWIPIVCAVSIWLLGVSPVLIILLAAIGGFIYGKYIKPTE